MGVSVGCPRMSMGRRLEAVAQDRQPLVDPDLGVGQVHVGHVGAPAAALDPAKHPVQRPELAVAHHAVERTDDIVQIAFGPLARKGHAVGHVELDAAEHVVLPQVRHVGLEVVRLHAGGLRAGMVGNADAVALPGRDRDHVRGALPPIGPQGMQVVIDNPEGEALRQL